MATTTSNGNGNVGLGSNHVRHKTEADILRQSNDHKRRVASISSI